MVFQTLWDPFAATVGPPWPDDSTARRCGGAMWRCSPHRGVGHDPASPTDDRGYADPELGPSDSGLLRRTSQQIRSSFSQVTRTSRADRDPGMADLPGPG